MTSRTPDFIDWNKAYQKMLYEDERCAHPYSYMLNPEQNGKVDESVFILVCSMCGSERRLPSREYRKL